MKKTLKMVETIIVHGNHFTKDKLIMYLNSFRISYKNSLEKTRYLWENVGLSISVLFSCHGTVVSSFYVKQLFLLLVVLSIPKIIGVQGLLFIETIDKCIPLSM